MAHSRVRVLVVGALLCLLTATGPLAALAEEDQPNWAGEWELVDTMDYVVYWMDLTELDKTLEEFEAELGAGAAALYGKCRWDGRFYRVETDYVAHNQVGVACHMDESAAPRFRMAQHPLPDLLGAFSSSPDDHWDPSEPPPTGLSTGNLFGIVWLGEGDCQYQGGVCTNAAGYEIHATRYEGERVLAAQWTDFVTWDMACEAGPCLSSDGATQAEPVDPGGSGPIGVVIAAGAAAAAAVAGVAAALIRRVRRQRAGGRPAGPPEMRARGSEPEITVAVLQLDRNQVEVSPLRPGLVTATTWEAGATGPPRRANLPITVTVPPGTGLSVTPTRGSGELIIEISVEEFTALEQVELAVSTVYHGHSHSEPVHVMVKDDYELELAAAPGRELTIAYDEAGMRWRPARVHARLTAAGPDGSRTDVQIGTHRIGFDPDVLEVERLTDEGLVAVFEYRVRDDAWDRPHIHELLEKPVTTTVEVRPAELPARKDAEAQCDLSVTYPRGGLHWRTERSGRDERIPMIADGEDVVELTVWYERIDLTTDEWITDDTVHFSHWTEDEKLRCLFGPQKNKEPWWTGGGRETSPWVSRDPLAAPADHRFLATEGGRCETNTFRVRVWPGAVQRRAGYDPEGRALGTLTSDRPPILEQYVPVDFTAPPVVVRLVEPAEPVPCDEQRHELVFEVCRSDRPGNPPLEYGHLSWRICPKPDIAHGTVEETHAELTPADRGRFRVPYTSARRWYRPGEDYIETFEFFHGHEEVSRTTIGTTDVHLGPALDAEVVGRKLEDPRDYASSVLDILKIAKLERRPGETPSEFRGIHEVHAWAHGAEQGAHPVVGAEMMITVATPAGKTEIQDAPMSGSSPDGSWTWVLPELIEGLRDVADVRRVHSLSEPGPLARLTDPDKETLSEYEFAIRQYEHELDKLLTGPLLTKLSTHRLTVARLLGRLPGDNAEDIRRSTAVAGKVSWEAYQIAQVVNLRWDAPGGIRDRFWYGLDLVYNGVWDLLKVGDRIFAALAGMSQVALQRLSPRIMQLLRRIDDGLEAAIRQAGPNLQPHLRDLKSTVSQAIDEIDRAGDVAAVVEDVVRQTYRALNEALFERFRWMQRALIDLSNDAAEKWGLDVAQKLAKHYGKMFDELQKEVDRFFAVGLEQSLDTWKKEIKSTTERLVFESRHAFNDVADTAIHRVLRRFEDPDVANDDELIAYGHHLDRLKREQLTVLRQDDEFGKSLKEITKWTSYFNEIAGLFTVFTAGAGGAVAAPIAALNTATHCIGGLLCLWDAAAGTYDVADLVAGYSKLTLKLAGE